MEIAEQDFEALRMLALLYLRARHSICPSESAADIGKELQLPDTDLVASLFNKAVIPGTVGRGKQVGPLAEKSQAASSALAPVLEFQQGYGEAAYGASSYGSNRKVSDGKSAVRRVITSAGQFSYRGHLYSLGKIHHSQIAEIVDQGSTITISVGKTGLWHFPRRDKARPARLRVDTPVTMA